METAAHGPWCPHPPKLTTGRDSIEVTNLALSVGLCALVMVTLEALAQICAERELAACAAERKGLQERSQVNEAREKILEETLERARQQIAASSKAERRNPTKEKP